MTIAVLLTNLGTPDAPTPTAVRRYLQEFLTDRRVVELPRICWLPLLFGLILPFRSYRSAKLYQKIWTAEGSALRINLEKQTHQLQQHFSQAHKNFKIYSAMRYGNPSLASVLQEIQRCGIQQLLLLPLYPQYSAATTATTFDKIAEILKTWRYQPELRMISHYYNHPAYITLIANSIEKYWKKNTRTQKILFSFHGLPKKFIDRGDPYQQQCSITAGLIADKLNLPANAWQITFQSRLGKAPWILPYTDQVLKKLPQENIVDVTVVCPGFSADCLETLEEVNQQNREFFMSAGGKIFQYVPCLNDSNDHIAFLAEIILQHSQGWER